MPQIEGQLFDVGEVKMTEGAYARAESLEARRGRPGKEGVMVHASVLIKLHATGQWGNIVNSDKILNRINIAKGSGRVLSVIGEKLPFVILTELGGLMNKTMIATPEEIV